MDTKAFGKFLENRRRATMNPATGSHWTQKEVADWIGIARETYSKIERGEFSWALLPGTVTKITEILDVSQVQVLNAMGYRITPMPLGQDVLELIEAYGAASDEAKRLILAQARLARNLQSQKA